MDHYGTCAMHNKTSASGAVCSLPGGSIHRAGIDCTHWCEQSGILWRLNAALGAKLAPLVAWLGSPESKDVTGCVFEVAGGEISIADGWRSGPSVDKGARWEPDELGAAVHDLLAKRVPPQKVYGS